jgi:excisionase family DNA binding protein
MDILNNKDLISIGEAAELLGVSIDTLRRWDKSGRLKASKSSGGHRLYSRFQIELYLSDLQNLAKDWVESATIIPVKLHCPNSAVFQARLHKMEGLLSQVKELESIFPLIVAVAGEIGNNSFDHNLGNWADIPGIFFGYDIQKRMLVLADRGQGVLATLERVRPSLKTHSEAVLVAFSEILSGRAPENRGNGLKFVRKVIADNSIGLVFRTGDAELILRKDGAELDIHPAISTFRGCLAFITF